MYKLIYVKKVNFLIINKHFTSVTVGSDVELEFTLDTSGNHYVV